MSIDQKLEQLKKELEQCNQQLAKARVGNERITILHNARYIEGQIDALKWILKNNPKP